MLGYIRLTLITFGYVRFRVRLPFMLCYLWVTFDYVVLDMFTLGYLRLGYV